MADRTASEVIAIFTTGLGLPVCDDGPAVDQKVSAKRARYTKDSNDPDVGVRTRAKQWFKDVADAQQKRGGLLDVVYREFADKARTAVAAGVAGGVRTMTPELHNNLLQLARGQCQCDAFPLPAGERQAAAFLDRFIRDEQLPAPGEPLVRPATVARFTAEGRFGAVALSWAVPPDKCDEVVIVREEEPPAGANGQARAADPRTVYRGRDADTLVDRDVRPGVWYRYRAHARFADTDGTATAARAVCLGEPQQVSAGWQRGAVRVAWEPPGAAGAVVFRRAGGPPQVRDGKTGPEPADPDTAAFRCGAARSFDDADAEEGVTYHYRVVADFGWGQFSKGADAEVTVPRPPPPVAGLTAAYVADRDRNLVRLQWPPVAGVTEYVVVRRDGGAAADRPEAGTEVARTTQCECLDDKVEPGRRYTYAAFAWAAGRPSRTGAAAPPVDILAEVTRLTAETGDGTVQLTWAAPPQAARVVVRRSLTPPAGPHDGVPVPVTGSGHARDEDLPNGRQYHYLVCCAYRPDGATEAFSPGARVAAVPEPLPEPPTDFAAAADGGSVVCTWVPGGGQVVVRRTAADPAIAPGHRLPAAAVGKLGVPVVATGPRAVDPKPDPREPYYTAFAVAGSHAVAGGTRACVACPDVTDLRPAAAGAGVVLRWAWPAGVTAVRVVRREGDDPAGPDDPAAARTPYTLTEYQSAGECFRDRVTRSGRYHYAVYAQVATGAGVFLGAGTGPGCRTVIQWEPRMTVRYALTLPAADAGELVLTGTVDQPFPGSAGLALVAGRDRAPDDAADGVVLFRLKPGAVEEGAAFEHRVSLAPVRQKGWPRVYCKLVPADPAQRYATLIVHPDLSVPLATPAAGRSSAPRRAFRPGPPAAVVCPSCFAEFPVGEMLYGDTAGGEPVRARRTLLDRLLGRPPRPPRNARGQVLTRKLCPDHHPLPFTAGSQASLVLGLVGAKYTGKSHFIASLVRQLDGQAGADLDASLLPLTDETPKRYRQEFHDPLFNNKFELPLTVGVPPPLVYDLTLDGRLWGERANRSVSLTLYDTAGENFKDPDTVRRMVRYVGVASGIMVLIDPLQLPGVREALPGAAGPPDAEDPNAIIGRVLQELEGGRLLVENARFRTPVAVVLTKCDVLRDAGLIEPNRVWDSDLRHVGYFHRDLHADMSGMMAGYVRKWSPAVYQTVATRFERFAFFGVSATGCASDARTKRYRYISPWRVEDPLLWLLAETGVIPDR